MGRLSLPSRSTGMLLPAFPLSGLVSLSPLQTPVGNREPIFELCKVFFCRQGTRTSLLRGPPAVPAGTGSKGLDPSLASGSNPPFSTAFGRQSRESAPFPKPKAGVALPSQRDKGLFCPGTILPLTSRVPSQRSPGTAPQSRLSAALQGTSASKSKAEVIFPLPSAIEAPPGTVEEG